MIVLTQYCVNAQWHKCNHSTKLSLKYKWKIIVELQIRNSNTPGRGSNTAIRPVSVLYGLSLSFKREIPLKPIVKLPPGHCFDIIWTKYCLFWGSLIMPVFPSRHWLVYKAFARFLKWLLQSQSQSQSQWPVKISSEIYPIYKTYILIADMSKFSVCKHVTEDITFSRVLCLGHYKL